jgi:hypothetical protein
MKQIPAETMTTIKDILYVTGGGVAVAAAGAKFCAWCRKRWKERLERRNATKDALVAINAKMAEMDEQRTLARQYDVDCHASIEAKIDQIIGTQADMQGDIRLILPATGAALDGLLQHDKNINGPVLRWRTRLENRIAEGVGAPKSPGKD